MTVQPAFFIPVFTQKRTNQYPICHIFPIFATLKQTINVYEKEKIVQNFILVLVHLH